MYSRVLLIRAFLTSAALVGCSSIATAEIESSAAQGISAQRSDLGDIIVTARRREERLQNVPAAVTVLDSSALREKVIQSAEDLNKIAGLHINPSQPQASIDLRGQGENFVTGRPSVIEYFAEVPFFQRSYYDLQSLQVVKGPQGTLFGETATAGVILTTPKKPDNDLSGYARGQAGNFGFYSLEGALGGPLIEDKLMIRGAFQYRKRNGYIKSYFPNNPNPVDRGNEDNLQGRFSVVIKPTERLENYTILAASRTKSNGAPAILYYADPQFLVPALQNLPLAFLGSGFEFYTGYAPPTGATYGSLVLDAQARQLAAGRRKAFTNLDTRSEQRFIGLVNQTRWDVLDNLTIRNIFGASWYNRKGPTSAYDADTTDLPLIDLVAPVVAGTTNMISPKYAFVGGRSSATYTEELQLQGKLFDGRLEWQGGFYYRNGLPSLDRDWTNGAGKLTIFGGSAGDPADPALCATLSVASPCSTLERQRQKSYAGYFQSTYAITPALRLTAGIRRTVDKQSTDTSATAAYLVTFNGQQFALPVAGRSPSPNATASTLVLPNTKGTSYNLTADWRVTNDVLLFVAHRQGYKGGGVNAGTNPGDPNRFFGPERIRDLELGFKGAWTLGGMRGRTSLSLYKQWYTNIQRNTAFSSGSGETGSGSNIQNLTANLADATIQGLELESTIYPTPWFRLSGDLAYTDGKYQNWTDIVTCSSRFWLPVCAGDPGSALLTVNHVTGVLTGNGQTVNFKPDLFSAAPKWAWSISPALLLKSWINEDVTISANIYHRSRAASPLGAANYSQLAGLNLPDFETPLGKASGKDLVTTRPITKVDVRADWHNIMGSKFSAAASVTNLTNKLRNASSTSGLFTFGVGSGMIEPPRMWYIELGYEF